MNIEIQTLERVTIAQLTDAWNRGFSDYSVNIQMDEKVLAGFLKRNGVRMDASVGAFAGRDLVGFWLNGVRRIEGTPTAYDSGTAISPDYRSQGISKRLAEKSNEILKNLDIREYILEVMADNERAFNVYKKDGFKISRKLICYQTNSPTFDPHPNTSDITFEETALDESIVSHLPKMEYCPSWQNTMESILNIHEDMHVALAKRSNKIIGYGIIQIGRGRIAQLGFENSSWNTDLPSIILMKLCNKVPKGKEIAAINVDERAEKNIGLLTKHGFAELAKQYEMKKLIS